MFTPTGKDRYAFYPSVENKNAMKILVCLMIMFSVTISVEAQQKAADLKLDGWPEDHRKAVEKMTQKYGQPDEATASMVIWHNNGPWKKTIIYKEEWKHDFPIVHHDFLEQFIDYEPVEDKYDEVAQYDGSVILERTAGLMSARCDKEAANILAINLAHEIMQGKRSVEEAREFYAKTVAEMKAGESPKYTEKLVFNVANGDTGDPDEKMPMKGLAEDGMSKEKNKQRN